MKKLFLLLISLSSISLLFAQEFSQSIKGTILDKSGEYPLIGVNVVLLNYEPFTAATTDFDGNFKIENVPVGRHSLKCTYIGYEDVVIPNILSSNR